VAQSTLLGELLVARATDLGDDTRSFGFSVPSTS
jgi:hypothetical protein